MISMYNSPGHAMAGQDAAASTTTHADEFLITDPVLVKYDLKASQIELGVGNNSPLRLRRLQPSRTSKSS